MFAFIHPALHATGRRVLTSPALRDLREAAALLPVIAYLAAGDLRSRYRRSVLGPLWMTLGTAAGTVGLGLVWSELLRMERAVFVPALTAGLIMWQLLSGCLAEATTTFARQGAIVRNVNLPLAMHPIQMLARHLINFAHNLPVLVAVVLWFGVPVNRYCLLVLPCFLLLAANLFWMTLLFSILGARFRDLEYMVAAALPVLMFLSPVFYRPSYLPFNGEYLWWNPFSHLIELMRHPLLGTAPPGFVVVVNLLLCAGGMLLTCWLFNVKRDRIAYWV